MSVLHFLCVHRWIGFERPAFAGEQFVLEKGEYPRWSTWTNCQTVYTLSSFRPLKVVSNTGCSFIMLHVIVTSNQMCSNLLFVSTGQRRSQAEPV